VLNSPKSVVMIDVSYDFRTDANGGDPDKASPTLRQYHRMLWSKPLPNGQNFLLSDSINGTLYHKSDLGEFFLASDSVASTFSTWKRMEHIIKQLPKEDMTKFLDLAYTIGGYMVFPCNRIDGKMTINGERGFNSKIYDRFDLTLECISRHYRGDNSPLSRVLARYGEFFGLFENFRGYIEFFLLQDLVSSDYSTVKFFTPFDDFATPPVPSSLNEYLTYRTNTIDFIESRNNRIVQFGL
jgi:hypothetical protein